MTLSAAAFTLFPRPLGAFYNDDPAVLALVCTVLPIAGLFQLFDGTQVVAFGVARGRDDNRVPALFNVVGHWLVGLPLAVWLVEGRGSVCPGCGGRLHGGSGRRGGAPHVTSGRPERAPSGRRGYETHVTREPTMNLAMFLTPLASVASVPARMAVRLALDEMDSLGYSAVPVVDADGSYLGTLTEGDLLRFVRSGEDVEASMVMDVPLRHDVRVASVLDPIESVVERAADQNFVPVVDSRGVLMGIVTRRTLIRHLWDASATGARKLP
jgi:CBS domain-containing protein